MADAVSDPIDSTLALLRTAFPAGAPGDPLPILRVLYDHMSDHQLAAVLSAWIGLDPAVALNDVYRAAALDLAEVSVREAITQLDVSGFNKWSEEE